MKPLLDLKNYFRLVAEERRNDLSAQFVKPFLSVASMVYGIGSFCLKGLYQKGILSRKRLPFPVISVGNLTWGGTGKTPLVEYLARCVIERRKTPFILTRGYGQDEVAQLKSRLPYACVGVGKDRYRTACEVHRSGRRIDVAILDDGFQHWPILRDVEIVTINALNPFGNNKLIPRGMLRESPRALRRANIIVLTHANLVGPKEIIRLREQIAQLAPSALVTEAYLEPLFFYRASKRSRRISIAQFENRRVATLSAVGSPRSFQLLLSRYGIKPLRNFEFCDHHAFTSEELREVRHVSEKGEVEEIITTEKDFYRSPEMITDILNPLVLATRLKVSVGEEILTDRVFRLLGVN